MKYNITKLLNSSDECFIKKITPSSEEIRYLKEVRKIVRSKIKNTFEKISESLKQDSNQHWIVDEKILPKCIVDGIRNLPVDQKEALSMLSPKFMSQGSFVYETMNSPCHTPPQEIDLDDGVYLPIEMLREGPIVGKNLFFTIIDYALSELASAQNWEFIDDKPTCARIVIQQDMHMDIPLYAIPREQYEIVLESASALGMVFDSVEFSEYARRRYLETDDIYLALRNKEHWVKSDPMQISQWFNSAVDTHGEILRRICRFLKAWRDFTFETGGPSSITLMACIVDTFNTSGRIFQDDSEALMACTENLYKQLENEVKSPVDEEEPILFPRANMSETEKTTIITEAKNLQSLMKNSLLTASSKKEVITNLLDIFGNRMPNNPDLVLDEAHHAVLSHQAKPQPQEEVPNMEAG
ncbi:CBASS cGAMP synthase [Neisseria sp. Ec49-e6-T10]|uniref:CBASS cGAMP synthase n=1 Tax=Neisseria sp. Ec49-e6-T10 TaxID=3140744 RepID=UPI003EBD7980